MKQSKDSFASAMHFYVMMALVVVSLLLMCMGILVYRQIVNQSSHEFSYRTGVSYILNKIRSNDGIAVFEVSICHDQPCLLIKQEDCWTYLYHFEGQLMESIQKVDSICQVSWGDVIVDCSAFEVYLYPQEISFSIVDECKEKHHARVHVSKGSVNDESE